MKNYLINWVVSDGFYDGSETVTFFGSDSGEVIADAYEHYAIQAENAANSGNLDPDCEIISKEEFEATMLAGFSQGLKNEGNFALLQLYDSHQQFEPLCIDLGPAVIDRSSYIASKLWSREDVLGMLQTNGYEGTEDEIDAVISTGCLDELNDCTEQDWEIIGHAIYVANKRGDIRPANIGSREGGAL